ncbi:hypothetical protein DSLASN_49220 [Desulfoluna limicola]|uniref:Uncharacterized protein n=1 Tax=Desulfoluna limicola TaxID=2810562 RepID=A0ABM7PPZ9_9BACT|nr:hypothetical protein DSLASN_49220 [Desulfoluna limicola]
MAVSEAGQGESGAAIHSGNNQPSGFEPDSVGLMRAGAYSLWLCAFFGGGEMLKVTTHEEHLPPAFEVAHLRFF